MDLERDPISTRLPRRMGGGWDVLLAGTRIGMIYESKEIIAKNARTPSIAIDPLGLELAQLAAPAAGLGEQALLALAHAPGLGRGVLLDHVEQLEGDGEHLQLALAQVLVGRARLADPGQARGDGRLAQLGEHLAEAGHDVGEVALELGEGDVEDLVVVGHRIGTGCGVGPAAWSRAPWLKT